MSTIGKALAWPLLHALDHLGEVARRENYIEMDRIQAGSGAPARHPGVVEVRSANAPRPAESSPEVRRTA